MQSLSLWVCCLSIATAELSAQHISSPYLPAFSKEPDLEISHVKELVARIDQSDTSRDKKFSQEATSLHLDHQISLEFPAPIHEITSDEESGDVLNNSLPYEPLSHLPNRAITQDRHEPWGSRLASKFQELELNINGFWQLSAGGRLQRDPSQRRSSIGEGRLHLDSSKSWDAITATLATDFLWDLTFNEHTLDMEHGYGWLDLRELHLLMSPRSYSDLKIGRQFLTWGTGYLLFINDLFPKDWNSFFIGRDEKYLKAPSNAIKLALYSNTLNFDLIYTPKFDSDRYIDGKRISYYNQPLGRIVGRDQQILCHRRGQWLTDSELALRCHRLIGNVETAGYYYRGYWKSPSGINPLTSLYTFPPLSVYGASLRGPAGSGILNAEIGYYDSRESLRGRNPWVHSSEWRFLLGYEQEVWPEMTAGIQYYQEWLQNYRTYEQQLPDGAIKRDQHRHLITLRLRQMLMNQTLSLSLFAFYSPSDRDGYLRPKIMYQFDDHLQTSIGGNLFFGARDETFFGQFQNNSNLYLSLTYGF